MISPNENIDHRVVNGFGQEWSHYNQTPLSSTELNRLFEAYFAVFPFDQPTADWVGFDLGCGSGRWARLMSPKVKVLHCIDPSPAALQVARKNLAGRRNCLFHVADSHNMPMEDGSMDFGYSLGVLHHIPDPQLALNACVKKLKGNAPFLLYIYYALENRPPYYRLLWRTTDYVRRLISKMPFLMRRTVSSCIAAVVYWPLARTARLVEKSGRNVESFPLAFYRQRSFYVMCTDALDRFGTRIEHRFTRSDIQRMMTVAGLERIRFSENPPYWCAVGFKSPSTAKLLPCAE
jgi:SAM-dependent methyltransferase